MDWDGRGILAVKKWVLVRRRGALWALRRDP
jgi:hypothetical protein